MFVGTVCIHDVKIAVAVTFRGKNDLVGGGFRGAWVQVRYTDRCRNQQRDLDDTTQKSPCLLYVHNAFLSWLTSSGNDALNIETGTIGPHRAVQDVTID